MNSVEIVENFNGKKVLVVGDVILDEFLFGQVKRINPEAPVPILNVEQKEFQLGGAANVAKNIKSLGGNCLLFGIIGNDSSGKIIVKLINNEKINFFLTKDKNLSTIRKTRALAQNRQLLRLDFEQEYKVTKTFLTSLKNLLEEKSFDVIIVSDYGKGTITKEVIELLKNYNAPIFVDPKLKNKDLYKNVFVITPNLKEAKELGVESELKNERLGNYLCKKYNANILITKGEQGMSLYELNKEPVNIPAKKRKFYDVTGAGDVVIATLALGYSVCKDLLKAAKISNTAAAISVSKIGSKPVLQQELLNELKLVNSKIKTLEELKIIINNLRIKNKKIVFTNGCFDILHTGHTRLLSFAKKQGDVLILGLNTDNSVKRLKGINRPVNSQEERAEVLSNIDSIDYIVFFDEDTPLNLVEELRPDIIVKGGDWKVENVVGNHIAEVRIFNTVEGKSTTNIIKKIKEN